MTTPSVDLALQLNPVVGTVLDKRTYGTLDDRPPALTSGAGLLRYEDKVEDTPTYADWPKWVYCDQSLQWVDLGTVGPQGARGPAGADGADAVNIDMDSVTAANAIVRNAVGSVSEGTTKTQLETLTISNLLAQILDVGPEVGIMPVATGVEARFTQAPVEAQIGTLHTFSGRIEFSMGAFVPPSTSGAAFPAGVATGVSMTNPYNNLPQTLSLLAPDLPNVYVFSSTHNIPITPATVVITDAIVSHNAGAPAFNNIGETITSTLPAGTVTVDPLPLKSYAQVLREPVTIDGSGNLTYGTAVLSNEPSSGSGVAATQKMYEDTTSIVVTKYNRLSTFLVLAAKFKSDAVLEVYDMTFGWQAQATSTWTSENVTIGSANIPYTRIRMPSLLLESDVRFEVNAI